MAVRSAQHFARGYVAGHVEELNLVNGLEVPLIGELPHDLFAAFIQERRYPADRVRSAYTHHLGSEGIEHGVQQQR